MRETEGRLMLLIKELEKAAPELAEEVLNYGEFVLSRHRPWEDTTPGESGAGEHRRLSLVESKPHGETR